MYPIVFDKARAEQLVAQIGGGHDIPAPADGWNSDQLLQVAGALFFAAMSHGPPAIDPSIENRPSDNGDSATRNLSDDLHMAIDFYSDLTMMVCGGTYDDRFEPEMQAVVVREGMERGFKIIRGGK
ncbi:MAG TPA: hypothetical protein VJ828_02235 [Lacipirellulaceae bacterium]|nr:hypothetical protein [Lacipirellulaceae bacterium]